MRKLKEIPENTAIHTATEADAKELLDILHENGYEWFIGDPLNLDDKWSYLGSETCYAVAYDSLMTFQSRTHFLEKGYRILSFAEFKNNCLIEDK